MASMRVTWKGDALVKRLQSAAREAIDETTAACVLAAADLAPRDTGHMANTLTFEPAVEQRGRWVGQWGNWVALYTLWVEVGARGRAGRYFLRRAADQEYPKLAGRIKARAAL